jgi:Tol biopolymer transport system component
MNSIYRRAVLATLVAAASNVGLAAAALPTLDAPQIFAPGIISGTANDGSPTFSPDGNTLLFTRNGASGGIILQSDRTNGTWSQPRIASFSGTWNDWAPEFSPDGRYLVYVSIRPPTAAPGAKRAANLWRVDRAGDGWGTPVHLPEAVNFGQSIWKPSIVADGSIYFVAIDPQGNKRLYCARFKNGAFETAQPLSFSDGKTGDVDPEVAPDESFMVFAADGRVTGDPKDHLFIDFRKDGAWGTPQPIRYAGDDVNGYSADNEPHFSHDLRTLYFSSDRWIPVHYPRTAAQAQADLTRIESWDNSNSNAWTLPLAPLLAQPSQ